MTTTVQMTCLAALAVAAAWTFGQAHAQSPGLQGTYISESQSQTAIDAAIELGIAKMNFITRPIARRRLRKTNPPVQKVAITRTEQEISVAFDTGKPVHMPADGTTVKWTRADGEVFDVAADWKGDQLIQSFKANDGQRINIFSISPDGTRLTLRVELTSPQLPAAVSYVLNFVPQPAR